MNGRIIEVHFNDNTYIKVGEEIDGGVESLEIVQRWGLFWVEALGHKGAQLYTICSVKRVMEEA